MENQILRILWSIVSTNTNCCLYNTSKYFYVAVSLWWFVRVQKLMIPRGFYLIFFNGGRSFSAVFCSPSTFSRDFKPIPICCQTFLVSSKCQWDIHIYVWIYMHKICDNISRIYLNFILTWKKISMMIQFLFLGRHQIVVR